jgi:hypothetical protein
MALGKLWLPAPHYGSGPRYGRASTLPEGELHWADDSYVHNLVVCKVRDEVIPQSAYQVQQQQMQLGSKEVSNHIVMKRALVVDWQYRCFHAIQVVVSF